MTPQLVVTAGPDRGQTFALAVGAGMQVGRSQAAAIRLGDPEIARVHFEIEWQGDRACLCDCSTVGTLVNGKLAGEHVLQSGDVIRAGATEFRYLDGSEAPLPAPREPEPRPAPAPRPVGKTPAPPNRKPVVKPEPAEAPEDPAELVGKTLHHYVLDALLSRGATGNLFRGRDDRNSQAIAVKVLRPEFAKDEESMARFLQAMKTMFPVRHANVVPVLGAGRTGRMVWVAMQFVEGESLAPFIKRLEIGGILEWKLAFRIAVHTARGLEFAHSRGLVHRNLTPTNVLIRSADKVALVNDVMLAKAVEGNTASQTARLGDVVYMAPERTTGATEFDGRSDLYSLGALMYLMLTGRAPFSGGALAEVVRRIRSVEPEKPKKYNFSIPDALEGLILRVLSKRPEERYQTARDFLLDLERIGRIGGVWM